MKITILTVLITVSNAKININIKTSNYFNKTEVNFKGRDEKLVTDEEVYLFNITHANLNRGIRVELGKVPDNVFVRDPTTYGNLFKKFKWPEVRRELTIKSAKIIKFIQQVITMKTHLHINNTTMTVKSKTDMMEMVENTALSLWSPDGLPDDVITNNVTIDFGYANWTFGDKWRDKRLRYIRLPFGTSKGIVNLKSGQRIESLLSGLKIVMLIEIEYVARLVGNIIADYDRLYGKYHFYSPALENIIRAVKLKNEIVTKEFLEVRFYTNPKIQVFDIDSGEELNVELKKRHWRKKGQYIFN